MSEDTTTSNPGVRVSWEDKQTTTDIKIVGGSTTVTRTGVLINVIMFPHAESRQVVPAGVIAGDDKQWHIVLPFDRCKIL